MVKDGRTTDGMIQTRIDEDEGGVLVRILGVVEGWIVGR